MRWVGHEARIGEIKIAYRTFFGNLKEKDQ
jgi:hypothetical protein